MRRCWLKNLVKKVKDSVVRAEMFRHLGKIMNMRGRPSTSSYEKETQARKLVQDFMVMYKSEADFIDYFKDTWLSKIGKEKIITFWFGSCWVFCTSVIK